MRGAVAAMSNEEGTRVGRTVLRWLLAVIGVLVIMTGTTVVAAAVWLDRTLDARDSLSTDVQVIDAAQCQTVLVEVVDARVDAQDWDRFAPIAQRAQESISITALAPPSFIAGYADAADVEDRLLGAQFCIAQVGESGWETRIIAISADAPDVSLAGLEGLWGRAAGGESVVIPVPTSGSTVVVSADGGSALGEVELVGRYQIDGARDGALIGMIGGGVAIVIGIALLMTSIFLLRPRGRHEETSSA